MDLKKWTFALGIATLFLTACNTETSSDTTTDAATENVPTERPATENESAEVPMNVKTNQSSPEATKAKEEYEKKKQMILAESNNITSTYKYITTTEQYSIFGELVKKSTLGKFMHANTVTVLAPKNRAFDDYPNYANLMKPGNEAALEEFVGSYILDENLSYKAIKEESSVHTQAGSDQKVNDRNGITVGGASISTDEGFTKNGIVLGMNELYFVPDAMK